MGQDLNQRQDLDDPPPIPPTPPGIDDCCRRGCDPCIHDLYEEELARYEVALAKWQQEHGLRAEK